MSYAVDQELIDQITASLRVMRTDEANRKLRAAKQFNARMNELEHMALTEIDAMVKASKKDIK